MLYNKGTIEREMPTIKHKGVALLSLWGLLDVIQGQHEKRVRTKKNKKEKYNGKFQFCSQR